MSRAINLPATFLLLLIASLTACNRKPDGQHPAYKELTEAVYASGYIYPKEEYLLRAQASGTLLQRLVEEDDSVKQGQLLFVIESESEDAARKAAAAALRLAQTNLGGASPVIAQLQEQVRTAQVRLANDSLNYTRYKNLLAQKATSQVEYDRAKLAYTTSRSAFQAQLSTLRSTRDQLAAQAELNRSQLVAAEVQGRNTRLSSFMAGKVYETYKDPGELVRPGDQLALLGSSKDLYAQLEVDESDFGRVRLGQQVLIQTDAYPGQTFKAVVAKLHPKLNSADQAFRVDAYFDGGQPEANYGLTAEANIVIQQKPRVLTIPRNLLVGQDSAWVKRGGKKQKVKFLKGAENFDLVEVRGGLSESDEVLNP